MMYKVEKNVYDFSDLEEEIKTSLLKNWHKSQEIECLCSGKGVPAPILHVVLKNKKYHLRNYHSNIKNGIVHDFNCPHSMCGYRKYVSNLGITVDENGITCFLGRKKRRVSKGDQISTSSYLGNSEQQTHIARSALRWLFLTVLKERMVDEYRPEGKRDIQGRLYSILKNVTINRHNLNGSFYISTTKRYRQDFSRHQLVIGWGNRATNKEYIDKFANIPFLAIDDKKTVVMTQKVYKSIYERATFTNASVDTGYWVLWREKDPITHKLVDEELIFVPAEEFTMIPVESSHEATMIKHLVENERAFTKPIIGNATELFLEARPDFIMNDTEPKTIIEVAGFENDGYLSRLAEKEVQYKARGFNYIQWNVGGSIEDLMLKKG